MKTFSKTIILLIIFTVLIISLAACPANEPPEVFVVTYIESEGGSITGETYQTIENGKDGTEVTANPDDGYVFTHWSDGQTNPIRQDKNIQKDKVLTAAFAKIEGSIELTVNYIAGEGGYIDEGETHTVLYGQSITVTAKANDGYEFSHWSDGKTDVQRTDSNIKASFTVTALFTKEKDPIYIEASYIAGEGGYIDEGETHVVLYGQSITITAKANEGYTFVKWSDGIENAQRTDVNIKVCFTVTAIFSETQEPIYLNVEYKADEGGYIIGIKNQSVLYGEPTYGVTAVSRAGYIFVEWSDGYDKPNRIDYVAYEFTVTAIFEFLYAGGSGTELDPFLIDSYGQLLDITYYSANYFKLTCDLDLNGISHKPIFDNGLKFNGNFDGGDHTISNMKIATHTAYPSLFGYVFLGSVANLKIVDFEIVLLEFNANSAYREVYAGAVCGVTDGPLINITANGVISAQEYEQNNRYNAVGGVVGGTSSTLTNCHSIINIDLKSPTDYTGGLVGYSLGRVKSSIGLKSVSYSQKMQTVDVVEGKGIDIIGCSSKGSITVSDGSVGGLAGYVKYNEREYDNDEVNIIDCNSEVDAYSGNGGSVGGLLGLASIQTTCTIENCYAKGDAIITNVSGYAGGFVGYFDTYSGFITSCYATGNVKARYGGGFASQLMSRFGVIEMSYCYAIGNIEASSGGGFCYSANDVNLYRCYATGNIKGSTRISGFIVSLLTDSLYVEECFSTGDLTATSSEVKAAGLFYNTTSTLINSYSMSNIYLVSTINVSVAGLVINFSGSMFNCYYAGIITAETNTETLISGLVTILGYEQQIINCHWLNSSNSLATIAVANNFGVTTDAVAYGEVSLMFSLANILDQNNSESVWLNVSEGLPQLKYYLINS